MRLQMTPSCIRMVGFGLSLMVLFSMIQPAFGQTPAANDSLYQDDFSTYAPGSDTSPAWTHSTGFWYVAKGMLCESSDVYDAGAYVPHFLDTPYEVSVRFRMDSAYRGAGLLFNSSSPTSTNYAHMVRVDDEQIIFGYFEGGAYYGLGDARLPEAAKDGDWHTMTLRVHPEAQTFGFALDGETIREDVPLRYHTGYLGLQNSGGTACFDDFVLRMLPADDAPAIPWPMAIAPTPDGVWVGSPVSGTVKRFSPEGRPQLRLNAHGGQRPFADPISLATRPDGSLLVLDANAHRLHHFDAQGQWLATANTGSNAPADLTTWPDGTLALSDPEAGTLRFFDKTFQQIGTLENMKDVEPGALAAAPGMLTFIDRDAGYVYLLRGHQADWELDISFALPPGAARGLALTDRHLFVALDRRILRYDHQGQMTGTLDLKPMGQVYPQRLAIDGATLYIADYFGDRIIVADTALTSPQLTHTFSSEDATLNITWKSSIAAPAQVEIRTEEKEWARKTEQRPATQHTFTFDGVQPSTRYHVRYAPLLRTIPEGPGFSREVALMSPPPEGKMAYVNLKSAVLVFANVADEKQAEGWPKSEPLPQATIDHILNEIQDGRRFYWINSGMRLHLDMDFFVVEQPLKLGKVFQDSPYYPPVEGMARQILAEQGTNLDDYESIYYLVVAHDYQPKTQTWDLRGRGGAFTNGVGWNGQYGRSWWFATRPGHAAGNNWLVVHEFHHQLDELFLLSGYPDYWFNHFSPHIGTSGDFGEHFDGNAAILRDWPADAWFDLDYGTLRFAVDTDMDGIPDEASELPMDEQRLGSNPHKRDTDSDGVSDLAELAFSNWITYGWGETYAAPAPLPNLTQPDSDSDSLNDAEDPYPLYPFTPDIQPADVGFSLIGATTDQRVPYRAEATWDADSLRIRINAPEGRPVRLLLDANADGWFAGRDNVEFKLATDDSMHAEVNVFHAGRADRWATMEPALTRSLAYSWRRLDNGTYQLAIARAPRLGLHLEIGEILGLNLGVGLPGYEQTNRKRYLTIHEPNRFIDFTLIDKAETVKQGKSP